jgi:hypothetical protein
VPHLLVVLADCYTFNCTTIWCAYFAVNCLRWTSAINWFTANGLTRSGMSFFTYSTDWPCVPPCNPVNAQGFLCAFDATRPFTEFKTWWEAQPPLVKAWPTRPWINAGRFPDPHPV